MVRKSQKNIFLSTIPPNKLEISFALASKKWPIQKSKSTCRQKNASEIS